MRVRPANADDATRLADLHHDIFSTSVWGEAFWRDAVSDERMLLNVIVAEADGGLKGVCAVRQILDEAEVLTIGVAADARRRGLGHRLLAQSLGELCGRGARLVFLEVAAANKAGIKLYSSVGFSEVGERPGYYGRACHAKLLSLDLAADGAAPSIQV